ncbi:MAG TPA: ABC transporter ATP-binding protein [Terriglobales bacterium]|nr:ABC transporter ATP-binding protein [Terriglobales bacterium]
MTESIVDVQDLKVYFPIRSGIIPRVSGYVKAVDDVTLNIKKGEVFGLVGESGSGKTTLALALLRLLEPTSGRILFDGVDLLKVKKSRLKRMRKDMQVVFQNPFLSLNPRMIVRNQIAEPLRAHTKMSQAEITERASELLKLVGLSDEHLWKYSIELSGGQAQRVCIARALALNPKLVILDEPTSSLDVSVQAQILNLLEDLQKRLGLTYLLITHDLGVVEYIADRVAVMYLGKIAETGTFAEVFKEPAHPYTEALLSAIPTVDSAPTDKTRIILRGSIPSPANPPSGCRFHTRCQKYIGDICRDEDPQFTTLSPTRRVACHLYKTSNGSRIVGELPPL